MSGKPNGEVDVPEYLESLREAAGQAGDRLAEDWKESFPLVRSFVVGGTLQSASGPGTSLLITANRHTMEMVVSTRMYGYEARYQGPDIGTLLESFENDLDLKQVPWREDWRRRRENMKRLDV